MRYLQTLRSILNKEFSSFTYLNCTQFLGAMNDNIYKLLIVFFLIDLKGFENSHIILSLSGAVFVTPFLLFSSVSGMMADRFSKRNIIVLTKVLELIAMSIGVIAFTYQSEFLAYSALFLMATQSALFSPSKYGIIPELVKGEKISEANGLMTSFTFLAIIIGTFLASFVTQITGRNFILAALFCIVISLIGVLTSFGIEYTSPSGSSKKLNAHFLNEIYKSLQFASTEPSLLSAVFGTAFFMFLASFIQLNIIPFAVESLGLTDVEGGYLFLLTAVGIGSGCFIAGKISGKTAELALVPLAGMGITVGLFLLDYFSQNLIPVIFIILFLGILGGLYQIPLDSYIQIQAPKKKRGQVIAATNFVSFGGVLLSSGLIYFISGVLNLHPDKGFSFMGGVSAVVLLFFIYQFFDYISRFIAMILSRFHFTTRSNGDDNIPDGPVLYICTHKAWNDTLLILGAQRRRMRFFIEEEKDHTKWLKRMYHLLRVDTIPNSSSQQCEQEFLEEIQKTLEKEISVCLFISSSDFQERIDQIQGNQKMQSLLHVEQIPIIKVSIEKEDSKDGVKFSQKFRVPAEISFSQAL